MEQDIRTFIVVQDGSIVFNCATLDEGLAFLEGRQAGVLYRLLCGPRIKPNRVQSGKRRNPRESKTSAQRKAS